jgi:hypothetical protein
VVLVDEKGEVGEVLQGSVVLGKVKTRPAVGRWRQGGPHGRGKQLAAGERNSELV